MYQSLIYHGIAFMWYFIAHIIRYFMCNVRFLYGYLTMYICIHYHCIIVYMVCPLYILYHFIVCGMFYCVVGQSKALVANDICWNAPTLNKVYFTLCLFWMVYYGIWDRWDLWIRSIGLILILNLTQLCPHSAITSISVLKSKASNKLRHCLLPHWQSYCHQARTV